MRAAILCLFLAGLCVVTLSAPVTQPKQLYGRWAGTCKQRAGFLIAKDGDTPNFPMSCVADTDPDLENEYEIFYSNFSGFDLNNYQALGVKNVIMSGSQIFALPIEVGQASNFTIRNASAADGTIMTASQPCYFVDVDGDTMIEYGIYHMSNNSGAAGCPPDFLTNRRTLCNAETKLFTYLCVLHPASASTVVFSAALMIFAALFALIL